MRVDGIVRDICLCKVENQSMKESEVEEKCESTEVKTCKFAKLGMAAG